MRVLLTGGAGYIGSHTALVLAEQGHEVIVLDNLSNGSQEALRRVSEITQKTITLVEADLTDPVAVEAALEHIVFDAVIHFAGLKSVGESVREPTRYYSQNINSTLVLLNLMRERNVTKLVFSSSATVYGHPKTPVISEEHPVGIGLTNPYGWSKAMNEQIIADAAHAWPALRAVNLRYFNPVGAHESGMIGEDPKGIPNNLLPYIAQVAIGSREYLAVFGDDYETPDGTGVRDFIHVMDLAHGHVAALHAAREGVLAVNLGTGIGTSVLEAVAEFERASGKCIPYQTQERRSGDLASVIADPAYAWETLHWKTSRSFADACRDAWKWQSQNPNGYGVAGSN